MNLQDIVLKKIIKDDTSLKIECGILHTYLIRLKNGNLKLSNYETAMLLYKIIDEAKCESYMDEIITLYEKLNGTLYVPPYNKEMLFNALKKNIIENVIFTKNEVINIIKYLYKLYPTYINYNFIILLLESIDSNRFYLGDKGEGWAFRSGTEIPLFSCDYMFESDSKSKGINTITFFTNDYFNIFDILNKLSDKEIDKLFSKEREHFTFITPPKPKPNPKALSYDDMPDFPPE